MRDAAIIEKDTTCPLCNKEITVEVEIDQYDVETVIDNMHESTKEDIVEYCDIYRDDHETELGDVLNFLYKCSKYDKLEILENLNDEGISYISIYSLDDQYKLQAIKEIWNDITVEQLESFCNNFKIELKSKRK
jgi:hypothetical protein